MQLPSWLKMKELIILQTSTRDKIKTLFQNHPLLGGGIVVSIITIILLGIGIAWSMTPKELGNTEHQVVEVRYGSSLREISRMLEQKGIIRNRLIYEFYVRLNSKERMAKSGRYLLGPGMSIPKIVSELRRGTPGQIRVTIPEGLTNLEIADLLSRKGIIDRQRFLEKLTDDEFISQLMTDIFNADSLEKAEGFLYPDTYFFSLNATEEQIITTMIRRFYQVYQDKFPSVPVANLKETVIMASIVEKEARKADERPVIAGVFYNRLQRNYPLQSCATVQYALGKHKSRLFYKDLRVNSPYNTYINSGLPPGPIANPGLASLMAAVNPDNVNYFYFVAKPDGSHIFSTTFEQHIKAQREANRLQREMK